MKKGLIYCRVSTVEQAEEGMSLQSQERRCLEYAKNNDIEVDKHDVFIERGESAKTVHRTELQRMMKFVKLHEGKYDVLLIYKIDRLSRDSHDYGSLKAYFAVCGVTVVSITERTENTPVGRFIETMLAASAQMDNEMRGERTADGMSEALRQGRYIFKAPFGYTNEGGRGNSNIVPVPDTAKKINKVFLEARKGHRSIEELRQYATKIGLTRKNGKPLAPSHFHKMIRNEVYKGHIVIPSMEIDQEGSFQRVVSPSVFDQVQLIIDGNKNKFPIYKKIHPDFPLRGTVKCPKCQKVMTSNWSRGKAGTKYGYYRCAKCTAVNERKHDVEKSFVEYLSGIELHGDVVGIIQTAISLNWEERSKSMIKQANKLDRQKKSLRAKQDQIVEKNIKRVYSDEVAKRRLSEIEKQLSEIDIELIKYRRPQENEKVLLDYSVKLMQNMSATWEAMDVYRKNKFQKFVFPAGLVYNEGIFTTPVKPFTVELNEAFSSRNSMKVTLRGIEPRFPG
jgi:site-specific DNA recombinase